MRYTHSNIVRTIFYARSSIGWFQVNRTPYAYRVSITIIIIDVLFIRSLYHHYLFFQVYVFGFNLLEILRFYALYVFEKSKYYIGYFEHKTNPLILVIGCGFFLPIIDLLFI